MVSIIIIFLSSVRARSQNHQIKLRQNMLEQYSCTFRWKKQRRERNVKKTRAKYQWVEMKTIPQLASTKSANTGYCQEWHRSFHCLPELSLVRIDSSHLNIDFITVAKRKGRKRLIHAYSLFSWEGSWGAHWFTLILLIWLLILPLTFSSRWWLSNMFRCIYPELKMFELKTV